MTPDRIHLRVAEVPAGATALTRYPDGSFLVVASDKIAAQTAVISPSTKLASGIDPGAAARQHYLVEFHPDIDAPDAVQILAAAGVRNYPHPDLLTHQYLVEGSGAQARTLTEWDEVSRVFPASEALVAGQPVRACAGATVEMATIGNYAMNSGGGWATRELTWSFGALDTDLPHDVLRETITRALAEWTRHADLQIRYTNERRGFRNLEFVFGRAYHGDPYPFDGKGGIIGHAFYPAGVNPEPIAGDVHFDSDESWSDGGELDLYSAVLHEIGHALGLLHSDTPGSVMYPYHRHLSELQPEDVANLHKLYAPPRAQPPVFNDPLGIVLATPATTTLQNLTLNGVVTGGSGAVTVNWQTDNNSGKADGSRNWSIPLLPLRFGDNHLTLTATDEAGASATEVRVIRRLIPDEPQQHSEPPVAPSPSTPETPAPAVPDLIVPTLSITAPASAMHSTSAAQIRVAGTARDNVAIRQVFWSAGSASGVASGNGTWSFTAPLLKGENTIVVRAYDTSGNTTARSLSVTRH